MRIETRTFGKKGEIRQLLIIAENEEDSKQIDYALGDDVPFEDCKASVQLADGYAEHYIRITRGE